MASVFKENQMNPVEVILPDGSKLNRSDLPDPNVTRWVVRHKRNVANAVLFQLMSFDEACYRYDLSQEELLSWLKMIKYHGVDALKVTRLKTYRQPKVAKDVKL